MCCAVLYLAMSEKNYPYLNLLIDCHAVAPPARLNKIANIAVATGNVRHHNAGDTIVAVMIPNPPKMTPTIPAATFIIKSRCN